MQPRANLVASWRLFKSDQTVETVAAAVLFVATVGPVLVKVHRLRRGAGR